MVNKDRPSWTEAEDGLIALYYPEEGASGMVRANRLPGRAENSIQVRASKLKIKNRRNSELMMGYKWPKDTMAPHWRAWNGAATPGAQLMAVV